MKSYAWLFYGDDGSGKSYMLASAIANQVTGEAIRRGIIFDCEEKMGHLVLPDGVLYSMRPDVRHPDRVLDKFRSWIAAYRKELAAGKCLYDVIGIDSLTEYQVLYRLGLGEDVATHNGKDDAEVLSPRSWGKMYDRMRFDLGYLKPYYTGAHLIVTAGAMEYAPEKEIPPRPRDPLQDGTIQPELAGKLRENIGHMFDMVVYVEKIWPQIKVKGGVTEPTYRYHFAKNGDFKVRNGLDVQSAFPQYLDATRTHPLQFDNILSYIT